VLLYNQIIGKSEVRILLLKGEIMKTKYVQSIICLVIIFIFANQAWATDWKYYALDTSDSVHFYDERSIVHLQGDTIQVWTKWVFSKKQKESVRTVEWPELSKAQAEVFAKYKRTDYVVTLSEINCATRTIQGLMERQYDDNGSLLDTVDKETLSKVSKHTGEGLYITPESIDETLYNVVCEKMRQYPTNKKGENNR